MLCLVFPNVFVYTYLYLSIYIYIHIYVRIYNIYILYLSLYIYIYIYIYVCCVWFSRMFVWFVKKPSGKPNKQHIQGWVWNIQQLALFQFSRRFVVFSLVFLVSLVFSIFVCFLKTFGKTKTTKKKNISKGESETFNNFVFLVFPKAFFFVFVGFLW